MPDEKNGKDKRIEQGMVGEVGLMRWLNEGQLAHLYLNQTKETYASLFNGHVKRPDFLVLLDSLGIIAVDAKNHTPYRDGYTLEYEKDIKKGS